MIEASLDEATRDHIAEVRQPPQPVAFARTGMTVDTEIRRVPKAKKMGHCALLWR